MKELLKRSVYEHRASLDRREYSSQELTRAYLNAILEKNEALGAFLYVDEEGALARSVESDRRMRCGEERGFLEGIPYSLKDNIAAKGLPMTCASRALEGYVSPYDATVTERLAATGAVLLGKNNMDEFAIGSTGEQSAYAMIKNPHDTRRVAGGSSGGSAAAVAAGLVPFSLGTDTGGSVRHPAAFCGTVGFKPTTGLLSRHGVAAMASSLDCVGILSRSVEDCRAILKILMGKDARDMTSFCGKDAKEVGSREKPRIAILRWDEDDCVSAAVRGTVKKAQERLTASGAQCSEEVLPNPKNILAAYTVLSACEAASSLSRYDGVCFGRRGDDTTLSALYRTSRALIGDGAMAKILFGMDMLSSEGRQRYYLHALRAREELCEDVKKITEHYDLILSPVAATSAFEIGSSPKKDQALCSTLCGVLANLSGLPAISLPMGRDENGMPLAVQLCAGKEKDLYLLSLAQRLMTGEEY